MAVALTRCWSLAFRAKQHDALGQSECGWPKHRLLYFGKGEGLVVVQHSVGIEAVVDGNNVTQFRVNVKISFLLDEGSRVDADADQIPVG